MPIYHTTNIAHATPLKQTKKQQHSKRTRNKQTKLFLKGRLKVHFHTLYQCSHFHHNKYAPRNSSRTCHINYQNHSSTLSAPPTTLAPTTCNLFPLSNARPNWPTIHQHWHSIAEATSAFEPYDWQLAGVGLNYGLEYNNVTKQTYP